MDNNISMSVDSGDPMNNGVARTPATATTGTSPQSQQQYSAGGQSVRVVVNRDDHGYGMKVSGDNPVYVQSVKAGGASEKAGLHAGDKIMKVNGVNVMASTHTEVVGLIRASSQVVLTVQPAATIITSLNNNCTMQQPVAATTITAAAPIATTNCMTASQILHNNSSNISGNNRSSEGATASTRITGPQPVDLEKQYQLQLEKEQHYKLMIEKEQRYVDLLRSQLASAPDDKKYTELVKTERNLVTLQSMLLRNQCEQSPPRYQQHLAEPIENLSSGNQSSSPPPPPLPKRNTSIQNRQSSQAANSPPQTLETSLVATYKNMDNLPPPLPPRHTEIPSPTPPRPPPLPTPTAATADTTISHQMAYPVVATCTALINDFVMNSAPLPHHQRTKSSPVTLLRMSETSPQPPSTSQLSHDGDGAYLSPSGRRLLSNHVASSMNDLNRVQNQQSAQQQQWWRGHETPPGTPPPPYPSPTPRQHLYTRIAGECPSDEELEEDTENTHSNTRRAVQIPPLPPAPPISNSRLRVSSPIHAATPSTGQQRAIISMEDEDLSDQEMNHLEDHGHFTSLSRLWEHTPHLAVFTNYVLLSADPNSLLFYLLTDLYKEGNAKEMRKWAFEIHSCFLVPGAPLRLSNVDENIAREIDDVLMVRDAGEAILRKIFWKARSRAKEELTRQLEQFQQKRTTGLGTMYGPADHELADCYYDKAKEMKLYEQLVVDKLDAYLEVVDKVDKCDTRRYYTAAALTTVVIRVFGVRPPPPMADRCPTFVSKEKSFRTKFMGGRYGRKLNVQGHQFVAQQYYTVIVCNNCQQIIYGISPQGYQCLVCLINLHRTCVKRYDDTCPGPINKKDHRGLSKLIRMRCENNDHRRKSSTSNLVQDKDKRQQSGDNSNNLLELNETDGKTGQPVARSGSDRRPDVVREEISKSFDSSNATDYSHDTSDVNVSPNVERMPNFTCATGREIRNNSSNINRSESVKEQSEKKKQRRNISDPSHNNTKRTGTATNIAGVDLDQTALSNTDSGRSSNSNISYNGRLSESPSNSVDAVVTPDGTTNLSHNKQKTTSDWESDTEMEPANWQKLFPEEELRNLQPHEKKRQDVINELFRTESSHVHNLRVLYEIFYKTLRESQVLKPEELSLIFPNIEEIYHLHTSLNREMKRRRNADPLVANLGEFVEDMFGGLMGENLQRAAATFCERQQQALEFIMERRKRDSKFDAVLAECEKKCQCRRLPLQGILPTEMQRLSKYPLLLERLINSKSAANEKNGNCTTDEAEELARLRRAHLHCKEILKYTNDAANEAMNRARLEDIQRHMDTSNFERSDHLIAQEFRTIDLTRYKLMLEGSMMLRRKGKSSVPVHVLLLEEVVVILQKEGDRFVLKFFQSCSSTQPQPLSPIIKISTLLVRNNAACKNALFLFNTSTNNSQMYDLVAEDDSKRELWYKHFSGAADTHNKRSGGEGGKNKRTELPLVVDSDGDSSETVQLEMTNNNNNGISNDNSNSKNLNNEGVGSAPCDRGEIQTSSDDDQLFCDALDGRNQQQQQQQQQQQNTVLPTDGASGDGGGSIIVPRVVQTRITADDWPLVQPSQVHIEVPPVHTAELRLSPLEQIRRKDEEVRRALQDKQCLIADLLNIPREHYGHIAEMASDAASTAAPATSLTPPTSCQSGSGGEEHLSERILGVVYQVDQLHLVVNEALAASEPATIAATGGKHTVCQEEGGRESGSLAATPTTTLLHSMQQVHLATVHRVQDIATVVSSQLSTLMNEIKRMEDDKEVLRKELHRLRENLHEMHACHESHTEVQPLEVLKDLESIKESPAEMES